MTYHLSDGLFGTTSGEESVSIKRKRLAIKIGPPSFLYRLRMDISACKPYNSWPHAGTWTLISQPTGTSTKLMKTFLQSREPQQRFEHTTLCCDRKRTAAKRGTLAWACRQPLDTCLFCRYTKATALPRT